MTAKAAAPRCAERVLARIAAREARIRAFSAHDPALLRREAACAPAGPLAGLAIGVKDIIATEDYPTGYGSPIYDGFHTGADAACVALLRAAGALCAGKTVTTEFAFFRAGPTVNPFDAARTPGGSSSGSAAAVATGMADIGLASQTAASLTRPASYCGIVGFKPSYGRYALAGVKALAPSFDTLGTLTRDVATAARADAVLKGPLPGAPATTPRAPARIGLCHTPWWNEAEDGTRRAMSRATALLAAHAAIEPVDLAPFATGCDLHATIMGYEAAQALAWEYRARRALLSPQIAGLIESGQRIGDDTYRAALVAARALRARAADLFGRYDVLLAPAAPGEAPLADTGTGSPRFSRLWTLLRLPTVTLPGFAGPSGLPVGVQLLGPRDGDERLLGHAAWAEALFPARGTPPHGDYP
ncbi:amidase [Gluconacetobacter sacchari]|uniref:amidase n=1 Tax=Gluconacetobacter sacchari TaxID=92759 RepID=UPI0039B6A3F6